MSKLLPLWIVMIAAAIAVIAIQVHRHEAPVTTDIFSLLPAEDRDPVLAKAMDVSRDSFFREVLFLTSAPDRASASAAASLLQSALDEIDWIAMHDDRDSPPVMLQVYLENRFQFLSDEDRRRLAEDPASHFRNRVLSRLGMPGVDSVFSLEQDPAGMLSRFVASLPPPYEKMRPAGNGYGKADGNSYLLLQVARLEDAEFDPARQQKLAAIAKEAEEEITAGCPECAFSWTGAIRFSAAARQSAENDIRFISTLSLALIVILFLVVFRRLASLLYAVLPLLAGVLTGFSASLAIFGQVHVLTLVFGTTLLGLTIDYVFHFLVHRWAGNSGRATLRQIMPGLSLGLATSLTAFGFLLFAGFPALDQVAVFSVAGLSGGWLTVVAVLPLFRADPENAKRLELLAGFHHRIVDTRKLRVILLLCGGAAGIAGISVVKISDDVRDLQSTPGQLLQKDQELRSAIGSQQGSDFFLIHGDSLDERLQREEQLFERANDNGLGLSRFLPSAARRQENRNLYRPLFETQGQAGQSTVAGVLEEAGFRDSVVNAYEDSWKRESDAVFDTETLWNELENAGFALPVVNSTAGTAHIARLNDVSPETSAELARQIPGVRHVEPLEHIKEVFGEIRLRAAMAVALAYLLVGFLLIFRYGLRGALLVLLPGAIGGFLAVGALGISGLPLTVFSLMGVILVLGIGADYSLFLREAREQAAETELAVSLAAVTTLFSFGLLALSSAAALAGFGLAVAVGIFGAYLAAPLCNSHQREVAT